MPSPEERNWRSSFQTTASHESPYLDEQLLVRGIGGDWQAEVAELEAPKSPPAPPLTRCGFHGPNGAFVTEADLRNSVADAARAERTIWWPGSAAEKEDAKARFGDLVRYWLAGHTATIRPGKLEAVQQAALDSSVTYNNFDQGTLDQAVERFRDADEKVDERHADVHKASDVFDLETVKAKAAKTELSAAREEVNKAKRRVADARSQSGSAAQAVLDKERAALSAAELALEAAQKNRDDAIRARRAAVTTLEGAKETHRKAKVARDRLEKAAQGWKTPDKRKVRKAILAKAGGTDPQKIDDLVETELDLAHQSRADMQAWSAVFVVSCVRAAAMRSKLEAIDSGGAHRGRDGLLKASRRHADYVVEARERKRKGMVGTYHAFKPTDRAVQVGDIICTDRTDFIKSPVRLAGVKQGDMLHGDIVTLVFKTESGNSGFAETIGGNVADTVRRRRYPLNAGRLIVSPDELFAQEDDKGAFLPFETVAADPTMLAVASTGRIFALLSLVEECKPISAVAPVGKRAPVGKQERFVSDLIKSVESPFLDQEILQPELQSEFDRGVERLVPESPLLRAFEQYQTTSVEQGELEEEFVEEEHEPSDVDDFAADDPETQDEMALDLAPTVDVVASQFALGQDFVEFGDASWSESEDASQLDPAGLDGFTAKTLPVRVAVFATRAARQATRVEVLVYAHGLDVCGPVVQPRPATFITTPPFKLGGLVEASGRPIVLVVPFLDWEHLKRNKMAFGRNWHKLARPESLNGLVAEVLERAAVLSGKGSAPTLLRLILAGHSRAYGFFDALASAHADPEMSKGALGRLSHVWALDTTYTSPVADWLAWIRSRDDLNVTVIYREGTSWHQKTKTKRPLSTGVNGRKFLALVKKSDGRLSAIPVASGKVRHCDIPNKCLPDLLGRLPPALPTAEEGQDFDSESLVAPSEGWTKDILNDAEELDEADPWDTEFDELEVDDQEESSSESFGAFDDETMDEEEETSGYEADDGEVSPDEEAYVEPDALEAEVLEASGLSPAELKAVQITSTFETGRRGGFHGLSGNFDGQGLSFGLVNWTIGTGSLQPLLRDFAAQEPGRWATAFGPHAVPFRALITPKDTASQAAQLRFAIDEMNVSRIVDGKRKWSVKEPWATYFKRLSEDPAFQRIQVRYVRDLLDRARYFCEYFGLKSERAFAFMFDAVSSHGKWWLTKKFNGVQKRRELLRKRLATLEATHGKGKVPERELLLAIADVLADTSGSRWRENVRERKRWFVTGEHRRAAEVADLKPRPDVPYLSSTAARGGSQPPSRPTPVPPPSPAPTPKLTSSPGGTARQPMSDAKRAELIGAAITQATTAGDAADRKDIADTLRANGTDPARWFAGIVPDATFLGRQIRASGGKVSGVHRALFEALQRAERTLLDNHPGRTAQQLGTDLGVQDIGGVRPPKKATGGTLPSYHCFGLAVDINPNTNPFVGNQKAKSEKFKPNRSPRIIERAMWLLRGERFNVETDLHTGSGASGVGAAWDIHHRASETLAEYLRLADDVESQRVRKLVADAQSRGDTQSLTWWKGWITIDRSVLKNWDFPRHPNPEQRGYMDLPRELVVALVRAGLTWGGQYPTAKDIMHFDLRGGPIKRSTTAARQRS